MRQKLREWLVTFICKNVVVGGHCGLCGKWVSNVLLPKWWSITICDECIKGADDE